MTKTPTKILSDSISEAFSTALADCGAVLSASQVDPLLQRSRHADFQSNAAMNLGRKFKIAPKALSEMVAKYAEHSNHIASAETSGPGFINIRVSNDFLSTELNNMLGDPRLGIPLANPQTIVVDYSSPNVAKEMHVGHLRSTVIGDACVRLLEWIGHKVIRRNHIGDWGTPFGMLIEHLLDLGKTSSSGEVSLGDLNIFYQSARVKFDTNEEFRERARNRVVALQAGDAATIKYWDLLIEQSQKYFLEVYKKIGVRLDGSEFCGESTYNDKLISIVEELQSKKLLEISDSADCVFLDGFASRDGTPLPLIVRKSDGGFGYAATDLAALRERAIVLQANRILYVVGTPQRQHFKMIFAVGEQLDWLKNTSAEHIDFGSVLGTNGKMLASRSGHAVKLVDLLDQALDRATKIIEEKNPLLEDSERLEVASAVGIGAIKYADLSTERTRDYVFDIEKMLSFEGNTAPYLQYANARINSLLREYESDIGEDGKILVSHTSERELALTLLEFHSIVEEVVATMLFHRLANYLFEIATVFSRFYSACPVLKAESSETRDSRMRLVSLTGKTLHTGLSLLGIQTPERM